MCSHVPGIHAVRVLPVGGTGHSAWSSKRSPTELVASRLFRTRGPPHQATPQADRHAHTFRRASPPRTGESRPRMGSDMALTFLVGICPGCRTGMIKNPNTHTGFIFLQKHNGSCLMSRLRIRAYVSETTTGGSECRKGSCQRRKMENCC